MMPAPHSGKLSKITSTPYQQKRILQQPMHRTSTTTRKKLLLSLGAKFCLQHMLPPLDIHKTLHCFDCNIRLKYIFAGSNNNKNKEVTYLPGIYYKSNMHIPTRNNNTVESCLGNLQDSLCEKVQFYKTITKHSRNITKQQLHLMKKIAHHPSITIIKTDKTLTFALLTANNCVT